MRYAKADLLDDVVSVYDQTKTTTFGRISVKNVDGKPAIGPSLNKFVDVFSDTGMTLVANNMVLTPNGRLFVLSSEASVTNVAMYEGDFIDGSYSYIGRVQIRMPDNPATTTTYRSLKVIDDGTTGWKIFLSTTGTGAAVRNGGTLLVNKLDRADFIPVGFPIIEFATGNDQKAVYKLEDPANYGVNHVNSNIATAGSCLYTGGNALYVHNGVAATHQYYVFDTATAPQYDTHSVTGDDATNTIAHTGHTYNDDDSVAFIDLTGGAGLSVGTIYFVRNSVPGVSYQLSTTIGGAAFNFTSDITSATIGRGFGTCGNLFQHKTGNLTALIGTLLLTDSEDFAIPQHTTNSGEDCVFFATSTRIYLGRLSELTDGATTWPSLIEANTLGSSNEFTVANVTNAGWSNQLDKAIVSTGFIYQMMPFQNNVIDKVFGGASNKYLETYNFEAIELQTAVAITSMDFENGWLACGMITTGQRGVILTDLYSEALFNNSYIITKVMTLPENKMKFVTTVDSLYDYTGSLKVEYRTSDFANPVFTGTEIPFAEDLSAFSSGTQIQFKISFDTLGLDTSIHAQLNEFFLGYESLTDNSANWELSVDDSSNGNPSKTAFRLKAAYGSVVPQLSYTAYDLTNVLLVNHNTIDHAARFEYSTNEGVSWLPLGTIPNVVGTMVRYTFATPPGVDIRPAIKET